MASLLGLAGYYSDHSDDGENEEASQQSSTSRQDNVQRSAGTEVGKGRPAVSGGGTNTEEVLEDSDSRLLEESNSVGGEDGGTVRTGAVRAASFDTPAPPPSKESRHVFMPLPSPLVRLDHASAASPFIPSDTPNDGTEGEGEGEGIEEEEEEGDGDIIKPEYRDMLPPEATGQANPRLQAKIAKFLDTMAGDFTKSIKGKKDYGNPAVLAQVGS